MLSRPLHHWALLMGLAAAQDKPLTGITLDAAKLLGLAGRPGTLAKGPDADLALHDGDPFEYASHCTGTLIEGRVFAGTPR